MQRIDVSVEEFTTPDPITVREDTGIEELRRLMDQHGIRHLPVLRDGRVVGVVSDRDVRAVVGLSVAEKLQVTPMPGLPRGAPVPTPAANQAIFAVPAPAAGKTVAGKFEIAPGHYAVFEVTAVKPGDVAALPAAQRGTLQKQIEMAQGNAAVKDYVSALRRSFKVSIDEKQL